MVQSRSSAGDTSATVARAASGNNSNGTGKFNICVTRPPKGAIPNPTEPSHSGSTARDHAQHVQHAAQHQSRDRKDANSSRASASASNRRGSSSGMREGDWPRDPRDDMALVTPQRAKSPVLDRAEQKLQEAEVRCWLFPVDTQMFLFFFAALLPDWGPGVSEKGPSRQG